jgi:hypothetical protein
VFIVITYRHVFAFIFAELSCGTGIKLAPYNVLHSHMASVLHGSQFRGSMGWEGEITEFCEIDF